MSMWPYGSTNPMTGKFQAAKALAANVPQTGERGSYTEAMFQEDFPQFTRKVTTEEGEELEVQNLLPAGILNMFLDQANCLFFVLVNDGIHNPLMLFHQSVMGLCILQIFQTVTIHLFPEIIQNLDQSGILR